MQRRLAAIELPPGYRFVTGGATKDMLESFGFAVQALVLAVVFIYMILASQFGSFVQPIAIMASLPMALIGVALALLAWRSTLNMFSVIGFVMLMGLVTKNAILLVDFANQARRRGVERAQALLQAAEIRLRPILMTTLAMVFGMMPLAIGAGAGAEQRAPMAHAVIGGVMASTLLTLLVVPVLYTLLDDLAGRLRRRRRPATARRPLASRRGRPAGPARSAPQARPSDPPIDRIMDLTPTPERPMDFERARFNMVEQQIRPWDVLDQDVLDLMMAVKREDFVPSPYRAMAFTDMEIPLTLDGSAHRRDDVRPQGRGAPAAGTRGEEARARARGGRGFGLHGRAAGPSRTPRDHPRDPRGTRELRAGQHRARRAAQRGGRAPRRFAHRQRRSLRRDPALGCGRSSFPTRSCSGSRSAEGWPPSSERRR